MAETLKRWIPLGQLMRQAAEKSGRAQMSQSAQQRPDLLRAIQQAQEAISGSVARFGGLAGDALARRTGYRDGDATEAAGTIGAAALMGADDADAGSMPKRIPFFPSRDYETRNWAPETISSDSLRALASAQATAEKSGVLSRGLASQLLPIAMTEGWDKFGVVDGYMGYPANPRRDATMEKMGLRMANSDDPEILKKWSDGQRDTVDGYRLAPHAGVDQYAKLAAAVLAEKAKLYGEGNAVERWNGKGRATEEFYGEAVQADSANHARKVAEAARMLKRPGNAQLRNTYESEMAAAWPRQMYQQLSSTENGRMQLAGLQFGAPDYDSLTDAQKREWASIAQMYNFGR